MTVSDAMTEAARMLRESGIAEPRMEAALLLSYAIGRDRTFLFAHPEYDLTPGEQHRFTSTLGRRARREPFQYITGQQKFFGLDFQVSTDALIPRPETETLVENAIERLSRYPSPHFLEIGVGSGCISVAVLKNVGHSAAVGVDISQAALALAATNARVHGVIDRLDLCVSDLFSAIAGKKFEAIVANPPYIPAATIETLQPEVSRFEPHIALNGGNDGLALIRRIIGIAPEFLIPGGFLMIEIGFGQSESVKTLYSRRLWRPVAFIGDYRDVPRVAVAELK
jgi:release factor glutamine methyltransferase